MFYNGFDEMNIYGEMQNPYIYNQGMYQNYNMPRNSWHKDLYPEIYNIIYPIVTNVSSRNNIRLNEETLERLTNEVYEKIENLEGENEEQLLKDLIRILIIREFYPRKRPIQPRRMQMNNMEFYHPFPEEYM
jgi:hypothetical protein